MNNLFRRALLVLIFFVLTIFIVAGYTWITTTLSEQRWIEFRQQRRAEHTKQERMLDSLQMEVQELKTDMHEMKEAHR